MVKCMKIIYELQLKGKESMHVKGYHIEEEFNLFSVAFIGGTRINGQKIYQSRH